MEVNKMDPITIGTAIGTTLLTNFFSKGDSAPIQTLNDLWYLTFGKIQLLADKKRAEHNTNLENYKNDLLQEVSAIPEENLIMPRLSIIGAAMEASKYYIEEEDLRVMFAKIIAASMDMSKASITHNAFIEIIKQLSPLDAKNLLLLKENYFLPIVVFSAKNGEGDDVPIFKDIVLSNPECDDFKLMLSSISNLKRLGLVVTDYNISLKDKAQYDIFENNETLSRYKKDLPIEQPGYTPYFKRGVLELTPLGKDFKEVCL